MIKQDSLSLFVKAWNILVAHKYLGWLGFLIFAGNISLRVMQEKNGGSGEMQTISVLLVFFWVSMLAIKFCGMSGIYFSVNKIKNSQPVDLRDAITNFKFIWRRIFGAWLAVNIFMAFVLACLFFPSYLLFLNKMGLVAWIMLAVAILVFVPVLFYAYYVQKFAFMFMSVGNFKIRNSIELAFQLIRKNIWPSIRVSLYMLLFGAMLFLGLLITGLILFLLFAVPGLIFYLVWSKIGLIAVMIIPVTILSVLSVGFFSFFLAFAHISWFLFFNEKTKINFLDEKETVRDEIAEEEIANPEGVK